VPAAIDAEGGVMLIDCKMAGLTVSVVTPVSVATCAVITEAPTLLPVARPLALIVATLVLLEVNVAPGVRSCVEPSEYVPVAVNCCVTPFAMIGLVGVTVIRASVAGVTVSVVEFTVEPCEQVIVVWPVASAVAMPAAEMLATVGDEELHVAVAVMSCVEPSVKTPVATNGTVVPTAALGFTGTIEMDARIAGVTLSVVAPCTESCVALTIVAPMAVPSARPGSSICAIVGNAEAHAAVNVMSCVEPSVYVPVAVNCCSVPNAIVVMIPLSPGRPSAPAVCTPFFVAIARAVLTPTDFEFA
jgi:hypothetical protein